MKACDVGRLVMRGHVLDGARVQVERVNPAGGSVAVLLLESRGRYSVLERVNVPAYQVRPLVPAAEPSAQEKENARLRAAVEMARDHFKRLAEQDPLLPPDAGYNRLVRAMELALRKE